MTAKWIAFAALAGAITVSTLYGSQPQADQPAKPKPAAVKSTHAAHQDEGEEIFAANCARCHQTPTGFSSNIAGTVIHHMRVRANLSAHDERELIHYLNP